jgi:hypothetical protein
LKGRDFKRAAQPRSYSQPRPYVEERRFSAA